MGASPYPISHLLEPSTTSYKAACLLFRYHLHINEVSELAGKHLMGGNSFYKYLLSFIVISYPVFDPPCHKEPLKQYIKGIVIFQATPDKGS